MAANYISRHHYLRTVSKTLFFRKSGEGPSIVILHGLFGMSDNWQGFSKLLSGRGYGVYAVDLRNHGRSFHDDIFNYDVMADDLRNLFSGEKIKDPVLIGHSMGGKVAMQYSLRHADGTRGLVVVDMPPRFMPVQHDAIRKALKKIDFGIIHSRNEAAAVMAGEGISESNSQFLLKNLYWKDDQTLDWRFNLPAIEAQIGELGKEMVSGTPYKKPVLFIRGENSDYIKDADLAAIHKLYPAATLITAPGAGHWVHADRPEWLLDEVTSFLKRLQ